MEKGITYYASTRKVDFSELCIRVGTPILGHGREVLQW